MRPPAPGTRSRRGWSAHLAVALVVGSLGCLAFLALSGPATAQSDGGGDYVELYDPEADPQEPPEGELPELRLPEFGLPEEMPGEEPSDDAGVDSDRGLDADFDDEEWPAGRTAGAAARPFAVLDPDDPRDPRSVELFYYGCRDETFRRDLTLFANGTLRLRTGPLGEQEMRLEELGPTRLRQHLGQLLRIRANRDFPSQSDLGVSLDGYGIDACRFALDLPGFDPVSVEAGSFDVLPLPLRQLEQYADQLAEFTRPLVAPDRLRPDYEPQVGDVLRGHDGEAYRIRGFTADGGALELESLDGNWRIFVALDELTDFFAALEPTLGEGSLR